ncbi:hypothetical protein PanWU01x14_048430, partial [Parasponia andersonii]
LSLSLSDLSLPPMPDLRRRCRCRCSPAPPTGEASLCDVEAAPPIPSRRRRRRRRLQRQKSIKRPESDFWSPATILTTIRPLTRPVGFVSSQGSSRYIYLNSILPGLKVAFFGYFEFKLDFLIRPLDCVFVVIFGLYSENGEVLYI